MTDRRVARELARQSIDRGDPVGWFEELYRLGEQDPAVVPWAGDQPNPHLRQWLERRRPPAQGARALVVGCGYGLDADELLRHGYRVVAFDISPTAISAARRRQPDRHVEFRVADLRHPPSEWTKAFDLVLEAYTLQALPPAPRAQALAELAGFTRDRLLVVARARDESDPAGDLPWPLTRKELEVVTRHRTDLIELSFEDFFDAESPLVRRFRVEYGPP